MKIVHFHNGTGGGVLSVIRNLLAHQQITDMEHHIIYTINREQISTYSKPSLEGACSEQVFYYSPNWNFYYTCRQLSKLLPSADAVLVAHDWLELGMVSMLGLQNPVVQVLHGDISYYYELALLNQKNIDIHICVSAVIERNLRTKLPHNSSVTICYERFPVPDVKIKIDNHQSELSLAYFVRDVTEERKQMQLLPKIEEELIQRGVSVKWYVSGKGMQQQQFKQFFGATFSNRVHYLGELNWFQLDNLLRSCNVMVLPSLSEGFPVSVVEAMKYGLVPFISYWDGAVEDLVKHEHNGFVFKTQDAKVYVDSLLWLANNPARLNAMRFEAQKSSQILFDPFKNTLAYENLFILAVNTCKVKKAFKAYGSRLDQTFIPNCFVTLIRNTIN